MGTASLTPGLLLAEPVYPGLPPFLKRVLVYSQRTPLLHLKDIQICFQGESCGG